MKHIRNLVFVIMATVLLHACSPADGNFPGNEYMPDMAHSIAFEANVHTDYYYNTWREASTFETYPLALIYSPVKGTVPRGYAGVALAPNGAAQNAMLDVLNGQSDLNAMAVPMNGHVPYYYEDTEEDRQRAAQEMIGSPYPITTGGLIRGQLLYRIYCGICHGEQGNGLGYIANDEDNPNVAYPVQPANLLNEPFTTSGNGLMYHAIMYGKNLMGPYADKLSYEERWQVIHWIRKLQADAAGAEYNGETNTFNAAFGTPGDSEANRALAEGPLERGPEIDEDGTGTMLENLQPEFEVEEQDNKDDDDGAVGEQGERGERDSDN